MLLQIKGSRWIRRTHLRGLYGSVGSIWFYVILSCFTVPLQRTAALPLESGYQPPIYPLPFLCLRFVRVRLNHQRRKRCLWIRTPRGVPPFSVNLGSPGDQTSSRLDVPRPSFDLLRRSWGDPKPPLTRRREDHFCGYPLSGIASSPELSPHISYYVRFDR